MAIDRAGFVGEDGATHAGIFDLTYLRCVPNLTIMTPSNEDELWKMLNTGYLLKVPLLLDIQEVRSLVKKLKILMQRLKLEKLNNKKTENDIAILSFGALGISH